MTMQEVTHSLQHLMAQATHDTTWITAAQTVLEDHAKQIDENAVKSRMLNKLGQAMKADIDRAFATVEENDVQIKSVIEDLGALTQQSVANLDTSLRDQVKAEIRRPTLSTRPCWCWRRCDSRRAARIQVASA